MYTSLSLSLSVEISHSGSLKALPCVCVCVLCALRSRERDVRRGRQSVVHIGWRPVFLDDKRVQATTLSFCACIRPSVVCVHLFLNCVRQPAQILDGRTGGRTDYRTQVYRAVSNIWEKLQSGVGRPRERKAKTLARALGCHKLVPISWLLGVVVVYFFVVKDRIVCIRFQQKHCVITTITTTSRVELHLDKNGQQRF